MGDAQSEERRRKALKAIAPRAKTPLRDHLEYFAALILVVMLLKQVVVEAFRIQHGSMAPTLVGIHHEVRCPNCGQAFDVGRDKVSPSGHVECDNCHYYWRGVPKQGDRGEPLYQARPAWLWNSVKTADGRRPAGIDGASLALRGASRIFVNKLVYQFREPRRWEVVVFLFPSYSAACTLCNWHGTFTSVEDAYCPECGSQHLTITTKNFIKRVVGFPGERIAINDGDLHVNGKIARKPRDVQKDMWLHVFDTDFTPAREVAPTWRLGESLSRWESAPEGAPKGGALSVSARGAGGPVMAEYGPSIMDHYAYDGPSFGNASMTPGAAGRHSVGDCRIRVRVRPIDADATGGAVVLSIDDEGKSFTFSVGLGSSGGAVLREGATAVGEANAPGLAFGESQWLALENYDDRIVAKIGGREVLSHEYEGGGSGPRHVRFGARGAKLLFERIIIERDIHYAKVDNPSIPGGTHWLEDERYFVLGDNSPASSDSRRWPVPGIPKENIIGKAFFVFWPVHQMKPL